MKWLVLIALVSSVIAANAQQFMLMGVGLGTEKSIPLVPCNNGKFDFSVATGCNTTFYLIVLGP